MSSEGDFIHFVYTPDEARIIIEGERNFFISNCGCRENKDNTCIHKKTDVCLQFTPGPSSGSAPLREATISEAKEILKFALEKHLVCRPFRSLENRSITEGICFCCQDCCDYFINPLDNICASGAYIERTQINNCSLCDLCIEVCYFNVRKFNEGKLIIANEDCAGCGLCELVCPTKCINMVPRDL